jgi:UDP-N-acetylmuramyl pentapeptide phosphotransferase/UDP-N-acetylglucosamine-1-phosphate transferase
MVALFLPLMVLGVPLTEAATSFLRRFLTGKNVMRADRRHLFHYLRYAGLSQSQIIMLFYLFGGIFGGFSILMLFLNRFLLLTLLFLFMVVIFIIYFIFIFRIRRV